MWAYTFIAAVNICMVNLASETKMSYVLKCLRFLLFGFSFVWACVNHILSYSGLTCQIVRGAGLKGKEGK